MIYLLASIPILILIYLILSETRALINRKKLNVPKYYLSYDDTWKESLEIAGFLRQRAELCNQYFNQGKTEAEKECDRDFKLMLYDLNYNTVMFIRLCHSLGCEVVIRQIGTNDLESRDIDPKIFAEKVSHLRGYYDQEIGPNGELNYNAV